MADTRDPTPGELQVGIKAIIDRLDTISSTMITKELFAAYRDASNERVRRLEDDQKEWVKNSTAAHVTLESESKARHAESYSHIAATKVELLNEIDKVALDAKEAKKDNEQNKRTRFNSLFAAGLALVSAIILKFFVPDIP